MEPKCSSVSCICYKILEYVFFLRFEMLKTADGSISGSLKVIESLKTNKKNKGKKGNKDNDWTWKEQVSAKLECNNVETP
jgi:hypothetical protein